MLSPGASSALSREEGIRLIEELQQAELRIAKLERDLNAAVVRHPSSVHQPRA
jgi:hypothetical protein